MPDYYDWNKTLTYDADVTMIVGARGVGKTYGLRKQCIQDYLKHGYRFVEISRFKTETKEIAPGYFDKVGQEFTDYVFKTDTKAGYIAPRPEDGEKVKAEDWNIICYFVALSELQKTKRRTFAKVKRLIMDEAIIDKSDRYHRYLKNEFSILANIVDSCSRERADENGIKPRVYLLANAVDLINPYFERYGITSRPKFGYTWLDNKHALLHYVDAGEYAAQKATGTVAGRMLAGTADGAIAAANAFNIAGEEQIAPKPASAKFEVGFVFNHEKYAFWWDNKTAYWYITNKAPKNNRRMFSLTPDDAGVDLVVLKAISPQMKSIQAMILMNAARFESPAIREKLLDIFNLCGI